MICVVTGATTSACGMAWKLRNGRPHLYLSRRDADGRTRSIYVGTGERARQEADQLESRKATRSQQAQELATQRRQVADVTALVDQLDQEVTLLIHAVLISAGYRNHHRGEWRRKRVRRIA
jgi:hypothetical protein